MELPEEGIFCVAKASGDEVVEAKAHLPYPIDLSKRKAELAVKYIAITPTWKHIKKLYMHVHDILDSSDGKTYSTLHFEDIVEETNDKIVANLRKQLDSKKTVVRIVKHPSRAYDVFRLDKKSAVRFSLGLAELFGVKPETEMTYVNESDTKTLDIPITLRIDSFTSTSDVYYLKSEQVASNFLLDNKQDRIVEVLHIPGKETVDFYPNLIYIKTEEILLQSLTFALYNSQNQAVSSFNSDLYIICHLRPRT